MGHPSTDTPSTGALAIPVPVWPEARTAVDVLLDQVDRWEHAQPRSWDELQLAADALEVLASKLDARVINLRFRATYASEATRR